MRKFSLPTLLLLVVSTATVSAQVCDLEEITTVTAPGFLMQAVIHETSAYVAADTAGIVRIDVTDPNAPEVLSFGATAGAASDIALEYFSNLLIIADGEAGVGAYALDDDGVPTHVATTDLGDNIVSISGVSGDFLAGSANGNLFAITLDTSDTPVLQDSINLGGQVLDVVEKSSRAYCALGSAGTIAIVNVYDPTDLVLIDTVDVGGSILSLSRWGDLIVAGVEGHGVLTFSIVDDTLVPSESLELDVTPTNIFMWDDRIHVAAPEFGIIEIDASLGQGLLQIAELELEGARDIALLGQHLFVSRGDLGFTAVDLSACTTQNSRQTTRYIPAAARALGAENSYWVTDVAVTNLTNGIATFNVAYFVKDQENPDPLNVSYVIGPGNQIMMNDIFSSAFGLESANGALRFITSDVDVKITSRTYNAAGIEGTYGQFIPALIADDAMAPGVVGALLQMQQNDAFRTNLGLFNLTDRTVGVRIHLYDTNGTELGIVEGETAGLRPFEMKQIGRIFTKVTSEDIDSGYALVEVVTEGAEVLAYASVVDQGSNDPIYVPTQHLVANFMR